MIFKSQYCFANISATEAQIFMKFETYLHKIVKNPQIIFRKDPCRHARTRDVNVRARVLSRRKTRADTYASCARICARIFTKNHLMILYYLMKISLKYPIALSFLLLVIICKSATFRNYFEFVFSISALLKMERVSARHKGDEQAIEMLKVRIFHLFWSCVVRNKLGLFF